MRTMYDSITPADIPPSAGMVGGYVPPSKFAAAWTNGGWARFAHAVQVKVTPTASVHGRGVHVLDVETGDAVPAQVPGWVSASRAAGQEPTVYMNVATWAPVINACVAARVPVPQFWVANWNGQQNLPSIVVGGITHTAIAHQYADPATSGGHFDLSVVAPYWPGVDAPSITPAVPKESDMPSFNRTCAAGTDVHAELCVAGCNQLFISAGFGEEVSVFDAFFWGSTPSAAAPAATGVGGGFSEEGNGGVNWRIDPNRPGPIPIPAGSAMLTLRYTAAHDFDLAAVAL